MPYQRPRTRIGHRRHRVAIEARTLVDDGMGGQTSTLDWQIVGHAWAHITGLDERSKEALQAQQITARHAYHIDVPYRSGIGPTMRLRWGDKTLEIHSAVDDDGQRRRLVLLGTEVQ